MILHSKRLQLRPIHQKDLDYLFKLQSSPEVAKYNTLGIPKDKTVTQSFMNLALKSTETYFKRNFWWAIILKESEQFIGEIGLDLSKIKFKSAEIFYALHPDFWKQGFAVEAVETILTYGFVDLNLHRITAGVATKNLASIQLLERVGMQREGQHRKILPIRGEWWDNYHYAILEEDFFNRE